MLSAILSLFCLQSADLAALARKSDLNWTCDAATGRHEIHVSGKVIAFSPGLKTCLVNRHPVTLSSPVSLQGGQILLPPELLRHLEGAPPRPPAPSLLPDLAKPATPAVPAPAAPARRTDRTLAGSVVAIDAGHGGMHTGGKGRGGLLEKEINLDVSLELREILEGWGAKVVMTRTADRHFHSSVDDDLNARVDIVNSSGADVFLSIHANYVANPGPRGFEVWVPRTAGARDRRSRDLARGVLQELEGVWRSENRGIKDEHNLRVLKGTRCPAVLVELEFVSNPQAERELARPAKRREMAEALANAVRAWLLKN